MTNWQWTKHMFTCGKNVFISTLWVSMLICAPGKQQLRQMTKTVPHPLEFISQGCTVNKEMYIEILLPLMDAVRGKQLVSSAQWHTCTLIVGSQKVPCQAQCDWLGASAIFPRLVTSWLLLFPWLKSVLEGQQFISAEKTTANAMRSLTEVWKNGSQKCFSKLYKCSKGVSLSKGTNFEEILCK
jgi:hypothetical protein